MLKNETKIGYALALLDIAKEKKKTKEFYKESNILIEVLDEQLEFQKILDSFSLDDDSKMKIIDKTFKGFDISFINTIKILSLKNNFKCFREILNYLIDYLQNILNIKKRIHIKTTRSQVNLSKSITFFRKSIKKNKVNKLSPIGTTTLWRFEASPQIDVPVIIFQLHKLLIVPTKFPKSILKPRTEKVILNIFSISLSIYHLLVIILL